MKIQPMLTVSVEASQGTLEENKQEAVRLAMKLNSKVKFSFEGKDFVVDPFGNIQ